MSATAAAAVAVVLRGLTLWRPWPFAILHRNKRIENRPWRPWRGVTHIALHAGRTWDEDGHNYIGLQCPEVGWPLPAEARHEGVIVGTARLTGEVYTHLREVPQDQVPWFFGPFGWVLDDVRALPAPLPFARGAQGLWRLPIQIEAALARFAVGGEAPARLVGSGPAPGASR